MPLPIVYEDEWFFAIDKPEGFFVHPPEPSRFKTPREKICLFELQRRFNQNVFPIHRLDAPTSGLVLFAYSKEATRLLSGLFQERAVEKTYLAVARGYTESEGRITFPLLVKGFEHLNECETSYRTLAKVEFPVAVGTRYPTARYSLVEVKPVTGRWHQIRRHFDRIGHPLLGDIEHGDSHHNRFFRDDLKISGLCLRAQSLRLTHPWKKENVLLTAPESEKWKQIFSVFKYEC